ncbi:Protein of unknown function [Catalinimonas alkaloidigena]|uniref:Quinol:cytochrome c oxidoreductase membrane protein n=1 Tax=Catalinimonas alkaloidigena TaxID=1075417 RepID=A0A1G9BJA8_9BACT|nr:DUF3341 domain-containing protein [Catalinimonas alkaloidigena]SDK38945.1 Protein of unknown function [Catalinimonas alkaloidigena]
MAEKATKRFMLGIFDDEDVTVHAVQAVRADGVKIHEVYSPFPIHGIDDALGYRRSRLPRAAFMFGFLGTSLALTMQIGMMFFDWPMIIGGKDYLPLPTFIPVTFELTVLLSALGMVSTFFIASNLYPGSKKLILDPRCTDNKFVVAVDLDKNSGFTEDTLNQLFRDQGASEVSQRKVEI